MGKSLLLVLLAFAVGAESYCDYTTLNNTDTQFGVNSGVCKDCTLQQCEDECSALGVGCTGFSTFHTNCYYRNVTDLQKYAHSSFFNAAYDGVALHIKGTCIETECPGDGNRSCSLENYVLPDDDAAYMLVDCNKSKVSKDTVLVANTIMQITCKEGYVDHGKGLVAVEGDYPVIKACMEDGTVDQFNYDYLEKKKFIDCKSGAVNNLNCGSEDGQKCKLKKFDFPNKYDELIITDCYGETVQSKGKILFGQEIAVSCAPGYIQTGDGGEANGTSKLITTCEEGGYIPQLDYESLIHSQMIVCTTTDGSVTAEYGESSSEEYGTEDSDSDSNDSDSDSARKGLANEHVQLNSGRENKLWEYGFALSTTIGFFVCVALMVYFRTSSPTRRFEKVEGTATYAEKHVLIAKQQDHNNADFSSL